MLCFRRQPGSASNCSGVVTIDLVLQGGGVRDRRPVVVWVLGVHGGGVAQVLENRGERNARITGQALRLGRDAPVGPDADDEPRGHRRSTSTTRVMVSSSSTCSDSMA